MGEVVVLQVLRLQKAAEAVGLAGPSERLPTWAACPDGPPCPAVGAEGGQPLQQQPPREAVAERATVATKTKHGNKTKLLTRSDYIPTCRD